MKLLTLCTLIAVPMLASAQTTEKALFAAGCFWHVQDVFDKVKGVKSTTAGYTGGQTRNPTYRDVCTDRTGHAETVLVEFDPAQVTYDKLLSIFWANHDPTTKNRQGPDFGTQYRSAIFYFNASQQAAAEKSRAELQSSGKYKRPVVTEIKSASEFYKAEEYHQHYMQKQSALLR